jgi:hypothetical protein
MIKRRTWIRLLQLRNSNNWRHKDLLATSWDKSDDPSAPPSAERSATQDSVDKWVVF